MDIRSLTLKYLNHEPRVLGVDNRFAVMIPFVRIEDDIAVLFEVRSDNIDQPGEVCFPGGHVEKGEEPVMTAIRETVEELGLKKEASYDPSILKEFSAGEELYGPGYVLYSFLCELDREALEISDPDPEEVSYTFLVPMERILKLEPEVYMERMRAEIDEDFPYERVGITKDYNWRTRDNEILVYEVDGHVIWGITARILKSLIDTINEDI